MIATIEGKVSEKFGGLVVIDAGGVGYGLFVIPEDNTQLKVGDKAKLYVHEHIRENAHDLYGFSELATKDLFDQLLSVNGVGPKMALAVLSVGNASEVRASIAGADVRFLQTAPGVGKRVAERIVVDLKDKVGLSVQGGAESLLISSAAAQKDEAVQALVALGYATGDAVAALAEIDNKLSTGERVKQALKTKS